MTKISLAVAAGALLPLAFSPRPSLSQGAAAKPSGFTIRHLPQSRTMNVADKTLADWDQTFVVMQVDPEDVSTTQWKMLSGKRPAQMGKGDLGLKVYMAVDQSYWYVAVDILDDVVVAAPPSSEFPYSGDCLEIFFAGKSLDSGADIHEHVSNPQAPATQAAFFQLDIPGGGLANPAFYLPDWRTDRELKRQVFRSGFRVMTWRTRGGWSAEARIPLVGFEPDVAQRIKQHVPMKLNIAYLDYDTRVAQRTAADFFGFNPDNVICLDDEQPRVSAPRLMRSVVFD